MNRLLAIVKDENEASHRLDVLNRVFGPTGNKFKKGLTSEGKYELSLTEITLGARGETVTESDIKQMKDVAKGVWVPPDPDQVGQDLLKARDSAGDLTRGRVGVERQETKVTNKEFENLTSQPAEEKTVGQQSSVSGGTDDSTAPPNTTTATANA